MVPYLACCPVNRQCPWKKTQIERKINYCEMFALLTFEVVAMQCNSILVRKQTKLVIKLMLILHTKFRSDNSREKKYMELHFFRFYTSNHSHLFTVICWTSQNLFVTLEPISPISERKKLSFVKAQLLWRYKCIKLFPWFWSWKTWTLQRPKVHLWY